MQITELKVTIGEVCEGYINDAEECGEILSHINHIKSLFTRL